MSGEKYRIKNNVARRYSGRGKKFSGVLGAVLLIWFFCLAFLTQMIWAEETEGQTVHVYDQAGLLTEEEKEQLEILCRTAWEERQIHILLLTAKDTEGKTQEEYTDDFYDTVYPDEQDENGIAVLIDMGERKLWISTAGIMRYYLNDREIDDMLDHMYDCAKYADYAGALKTAVMDADDAIERGIAEGDYLVDGNGRVHHLRRITPVEGMLAAAAGVFVFCFVYFGVSRSYRRKGNPDPAGYVRTGETAFSSKRDFLVDRHVTVRKIPKDPPPGNGSGRSTVHTSSSGRSHGGGGRGF